MRRILLTAAAVAAMIELLVFGIAISVGKIGGEGPDPVAYVTLFIAVHGCDATPFGGVLPHPNGVPFHSQG